VQVENIISKQLFLMIIATLIAV